MRRRLVVNSIPLAIEAALEATAERQRASNDRINQLGLALEQAHYEAAHARRQYDSVEQENRMVVGELERRWNERLVEVARLDAVSDRPPVYPYWHQWEEFSERNPPPMPMASAERPR